MRASSDHGGSVTDGRADRTGRAVSETSAGISDELLRLLIASVEDYAIFMLDPDGKVISWNRGAERIKGYRADEIIGEDFSCLYTAQQVAAGKPRHDLETACREGSLAEEAWRMRKDGSLFWASVVITPVYDHGELRGYAKVTRDLTSQREAEERERRLAQEQGARQRLFGFLMQVPAIVAITRGPQHIYELLNPQARAIFGAGILGQTVREAWPDTGEALLSRFDRVYRTGEPFVDREYSIDREWDERGVTRRYFNFTYQPLRDPEGAVDSVMTLAVDVTDLVVGRQQVEQALKQVGQQQQWLQNILDSMPTPLLLLDAASGSRVFANQPARALAGEGVALDAERPYFAVHPCTDPDGVPLDAAQLPEQLAVSGHVLQRYPVDWHRPDGTKSLWVDSTRLAAGYGHPETVLLAIEDVTDQRAMQAALQEAVQQRDAFISIASHELKTPLAALHLQVQNLQSMAARSDAADSLPKIRDWLARVRRQADRMARLINQLLDVSRLTIGRLELETEQVDLSSVANEVAERFADEVERVGSQLHVRADRPIMGCWDPMRLDQVLTNLVSNAIRYGGGAPIEIEVGAEPGHAWLRVRDHGHGIALEDQQRIFERFERAVPPKAARGFGLGLWIVREIAQAHGGEVQVHSRPGEGAMFEVRLPSG